MPLHHPGNVNHELNQRRSAIILCLATTFQVRVDGRLKPGVSAKDIILALIARIGAGGGTESEIEYTGGAIRALDMEERITVCNMSIEAGARTRPKEPSGTRPWRAGRRFPPTRAILRLTRHAAWGPSTRGFPRSAGPEGTPLSPVLLSELEEHRRQDRRRY
jgi:hypothetical protein